MGKYHFRSLSAYPAGTVSCLEFAFRHGVDIDRLRSHILYGIDGERIEATEVPHGTTIRRYLTPEQQSAALAFWDKHGVKHRKRG